MVPSNLSSLSSVITSSLTSKPSNTATGPAGKVNISGLTILKSKEVKELVPNLVTSTSTLSILEATPALNGLYAAGVSSYKASFKSVLDILFFVRSSDVAFEYTKAVSQSQLPVVPLNP